ncbi:MAG: glycosyltransferase family 4 protein [Flavobacteriaceae bacterium]|nr:glycosyltransferase family 4 protein [Flavobacteriaceae bacterium]
MTVLQLIDTLNAGGAERVALNYANELSQHLEASYLCATRQEGLLKKQLKPEVGYLFLRKKSAIDLAAVIRLARYVKKYQIGVIHAHGTSFMTAVLCKLFVRKLKVVWHDHYGKSEELENRPLFFLKLASRFIHLIVVVNPLLKIWCETHLPVKKVIYLHNFSILGHHISESTKLSGLPGKRIVCLANFRPQKGHLFLLTVFRKLSKIFPEWTLHLVGKNFGDAYFNQIRQFIETHQLQENIFIYDSREDIHHILSQANIGVLPSQSEGFPLALLEYGLAGLPVVVTNVGECAGILGNPPQGLLIESGNAEQLKASLSLLITDKQTATRLGMDFKNRVQKQFSPEKAVTKLLACYNEL